MSEAFKCCAKSRIRSTGKVSAFKWPSGEEELRYAKTGVRVTLGRFRGENRQIPPFTQTFITSSSLWELFERMNWIASLDHCCRSQLTLLPTLHRCCNLRRKYFINGSLSRWASSCVLKFSAHARWNCMIEWSSEPWCWTKWRYAVTRGRGNPLASSCASVKRDSPSSLFVQYTSGARQYPYSATGYSLILKTNTSVSRIHCSSWSAVKGTHIRHSTPVTIEAWMV